MPYNAGRGIQSGVSYAGTGATIGSVIPGIGTAIGAGLGGLYGLSQGWSDDEDTEVDAFGRRKKLSTLDKYQKQLYKDYNKGLYGNGKFADMYKAAPFDPMKANANFDANISRPAYRSFNENVVPGITGQFRNEGLQQSSYVGGALANAGRDLQEGLNAQRGNYLYQGERQAQQDQQALNLQRMSGIENQLNRQTFGYVRPQEKGPGAIEQILSSVGPTAAKMLADYFANKGTSSPSKPTQTTRSDQGG